MLTAIRVCQFSELPKNISATKRLGSSQNTGQVLPQFDTRMVLNRLRHGLGRLSPEHG
jgi:hypothetical protein